MHTNICTHFAHSCFRLLPLGCDIPYAFSMTMRHCENRYFTLGLVYLHLYPWHAWPHSTFVCFVRGEHPSLSRRKRATAARCANITPGLPIPVEWRTCWLAQHNHLCLNMLMPCPSSLRRLQWPLEGDYRYPRLPMTVSLHAHACCSKHRDTRGN